MSSGHFPEASTSTRLDASRLAEALPSGPFSMAQRTVYSSLYPMQGAVHPPLFSSPAYNTPALFPLVPGAYDAGSVHYAPNFQGNSTTFSQACFIPPMENPVLPMSNTNLPPMHYPFHRMPVGNVTRTTTLPPSVDNRHHEQPAPSTFLQYPLPTQSEAALDQGQIQNLQHHRQFIQDDLTVAELPREPGDVHREAYQTDEESHLGLVAPKVVLDGYRCNNESHPPENKTIHVCLNNPNTQCSGRGTFCLEILSAFVQKYPNSLSAEQIAYFVIDAMALLVSNAGHSQVDTGDSPTSQRRQMDSGTASLESDTTNSASTSGYLTPFSQSRSNSAAGSSSMGPRSPPAAKRQRSEDYPREGAKRQRQEECTDAQGTLEHESEACNNEIPGGKEKRRRKKKPCDEGEFYCRICMILGKSCRPLSRKDALKRHIATVHEMFMALFGHEGFDILRPRRSQDEDLVPLIMSCIMLQSQARQRGAEIRPAYDLTLLYPEIATSLNLS